jgi:addiction module HigA family antidote
VCRPICSFLLRRSRRPGVPPSEWRPEPDRWRVTAVEWVLDHSMSCSSFRDWNRGLSLTLAKIRKEPMGQLPGEILKEEFLNEIGVSQNQLAQAIGVPGNRIHAIVNGTRDITADTDLRLCKFFGPTDGYFLRL